MRVALRAIHTMRGQTWPNPCVGCALVDPATDTIITTGISQKGGRPHAEVNALEQAGPRAKGAHAYVTLEPCNHTSPHKPMSCTQTLIDAGITAVFIGMPDPDTRMAGKSIQILRDAGMDVHVGLCFDECYHAHRGHITRIIEKRPYITLQLAKTNARAQQSWVRSHIQRGKVDGVLIDIETALTDNLQLTNKNMPAHHHPVRIVLDANAQLPMDSELVQTAHETPTWVLTNVKSAALEKAGVKILPLGTDIYETIRILYDAGMGHILCEGHAYLAQNLLDANLVDEALMIECARTTNNSATPWPTLPKSMVLRNTDAIGADTWQIYDSENSMKKHEKFDVRKNFA